MLYLSASLALAANVAVGTILTVVSVEKQTLSEDHSHFGLQSLTASEVTLL